MTDPESYVIRTVPRNRNDRSAARIWYNAHCG